ncbi:unnamed protein product [Prunus armeniaca]
MPNKKDLLDRLNKAVIFSKFDMKSGYWQIQIAENDKYKTAFNVPFGHYEWNILPFGLKNAPSELQNIMTDIFNPYTAFTIVYIDDVLVYSNSLEQHFKHLNIFLKVVKHAGLVVSAKKMKLFSSKVHFLGHNINEGLIVPIDRAISFADKFPDEIRDKQQLQRLKKNPVPWSDENTKAVRRLKVKVKELPCLALANPKAFKIVETDASEVGYEGILKQKVDNSEQLVRVRTRSSGQMTPSKSSSALIKSFPNNPKPLMISSRYNMGKEKQIAENPFREYMNMSVAIIEMNDLDKRSNFLAEKYLRDNLPPLNKPRIFYETVLLETKWWDKFTRDHLAPIKIIPALIPSPDSAAAQPLVTSSDLSVSQRLQLLIDQPGSSSSKEDLKKKVLEILDLDDESMASASATQP